VFLFMTILELIQKTTPYFEKAGIPTPRLDVELLLAHVLNLKRMELYIQFERNLTESELDKLRPFVKRRASREPLQHILGTVEFGNLTLAVNSKALIPRHETEILVQKAIQLLNKDFTGKILDIGTGTGAIILSVLNAFPGSFGIAVDLSPEALSLARSNASNTKLSERVEFRQGSLFEVIREDEVFDLIVSNPPYIPTKDIEVLQKEVLFDPILALDGGSDGLDLIRTIIINASKHLKEDGHLLLEIGINQDDAVRNLLEQNKFKNIEFIKDLNHINRVVKSQK
jgi:release factor glutamine methyltransferase